MDAERKLIVAMNETGSMAGAIAARLSARSAEAVRKAEAMRALEAALRLEARARRDGPSWAKGGAMAHVWRFASERLWRLFWKESAAEIGRRADEAGKGARAAGRKAAIDAAAARRIAGLPAALEREAAGLESLPPMAAGLRDRAETAVRRAAGLGRGRDPKPDAVIERARDLVSVSRRWRAGAKAAALNGGKRPERPGAQRSVVLPERVYLPIPFGLGTYAKAAGARYDPEAGRGSRWFVPPGEPLAKFEQFLPLAYRNEPPALSFPPVRNGASSQNLWSLFDKGTWNRIRQVNYERTGRRCVLCGKQSGNLLRHLDPQGERKIGTVECHEIWDWSVPDPGVSVGIQRLREIQVVCFECHATYHDGWARKAARQAGLENEVARFLMKRRSFLTRKDPVEVALEMKAEAARLRAHSDVGLWIVDLTHLGQQDYMRQVAPVFMEGNSPGVRPGQVAGLGFVTDRGAAWQASSARGLYASLADLYSLNPLKRLRTRSVGETETLANPPLTKVGP